MSIAITGIMLAWVGCAILVAGAAMTALGYFTRTRWCFLVGLLGPTLCPGILCDSVGTRWWATAGHVIIAFGALGAYAFAAKSAARFANPMRVERPIAIAIQILTSLVTIAQVVQLDAPSIGVHVVWATEFLAGLALAAVLGAASYRRT
jgi:hypothetical protein